MKWDFRGASAWSAAVLLLGGCVLIDAGKNRCVTSDDCLSGYACVSGVCEGFVSGPVGCAEMTVDRAVDPNDPYDISLVHYGWSDASCARRTAELASNEVPRVTASYVCCMRWLKWQGQQSHQSPGYGSVSIAFDGGMTSTEHLAGATRVVLAGAHHAIHEYRWRLDAGGPVDVTVHWFFATGRTFPVYAVTLDTTLAGPDLVHADVTAPTGLFFDLSGNYNTGGFSWGDRYRFATTETLRPSNEVAWSWAEPNVVPFESVWGKTDEYEAGLVQTQTFEQHPAGADRGQGACWGRMSTSADVACVDGTLGSLPAARLWPFESGWSTSVGQTSYQAFGKTLSGYPYQSYSVYAVSGLRGSTAVQTAEVAGTAGHSSLTAQVGWVATHGPAGVGRTDQMTYSPPGYNPVYGIFEAQADHGVVELALSPGSPLTSPTFHVTGFGHAATKVSRDGVALPDSAYFATYDATTGDLWLTLNGRAESGFSLRVE